MHKRWTDEALIAACKISKNKTEVLKRLNLFLNSGNYQTVDKYIKSLNIDISHFEYGISHNSPKSKISLNDILVEDSQYSKTSDLKNRLVKEGLLEYKCSICNIVEWNKEKLILHLDHINGKRTDNRLSNLRLLCPNCHSQTDTYCRGASRFKKEKVCIDCGNEIQIRSIRCFYCAVKSRKKIFKINWPDEKLLLEMVQELGFKETGKQLGVSGNSVKKRLKK